MSSKNVKIFDETGCLSEDALVEYAHGQLGIHLKKQVEIHINECDFCRDALEGISLMESKESSRAAIAFVNAKIAGKPEPKGGKVIMMNFQRLAAAVLLFFVLGGGVLYITLNNPFRKDVAVNEKVEEKTLAENKQQPVESVPPAIITDSVSVAPGSAEPLIATTEQAADVAGKLPAQEVITENQKAGDLAAAPSVTYNGTGSTTISATTGDGTLDYSKMTATGGISNAAGNFYNPRLFGTMADSTSTFKNGSFNDGYFSDAEQVQTASAPQIYKSTNTEVLGKNAGADKTGAYLDGNLIRTDDDVINTYDWAAAEKKKEERKEEKAKEAEADKKASEEAAALASTEAERKAAARKKADEQLAKLAEEGRMKAEADAKAKAGAEKKAKEEARLAAEKKSAEMAMSKSKTASEDASRLAEAEKKAAEASKVKAAEEAKLAASKVADEQEEVAQARKDVEEQALNKVESKNNEGKEDKKVYAIADQMPEYPGGVEALKKYIAGNIKYPQAAKDNGISGTVLINYVVTPTGKVTDVKIAKGVDEALDKEAVRVVSGVKGYVGGKQGGKPVNVLLSIPVKFE